MADEIAPLTIDDFHQLHVMLMADDADTRAQGLTLAKKLRPDEQQKFFEIQQQGNRGRGERQDTNMADVGGYGIPPEAVFMGPMQAGRAATTGGLSLVQRAIAAGKGFGEGAHPIVKYEVIRHGLQTIGLPTSVSTVLAMVWSGRGAAKGEAPTSVEKSIDEAVASGQLRRMPGWTRESAPMERGPGGRPTGKAPIVTAPPAAEAPITPTGTPPALPQGSTVAPPAPAPVVPRETPTAAPTPPAAPIAQGVAMKQGIDAFKAAGKMPQPGEVSWVTLWIQNGLSPTEAVTKAIQMRPAAAVNPAEAFAARFGTPSDTEVGGVVAAKNARTTRAKGGTK